MMKRGFAVVVGVVFALASTDAGAGDVVSPAASQSPQRVLVGANKATNAFANAWLALGTTANKCSERELHFDYWPNGGLRNFYCHALTTMAYQAVVKLAGVSPFVRGPHGQFGGNLSLNDPRDFGRYNPAFVQFLVDNAIPGASDQTLRVDTQSLYDSYVRQLARVYFVVHARLEAKPAWKKQMRNEYMRVMDEKKPDWGSYYDKFSTFLGEADSDWGGYDPNLQSASVAWWLRRDVDKTAPLFFEGLTKLLKTYDATWLETHDMKPKQ